eukprot:Nitzschia sp. Nitz4//scaffold369_size34440//25170//26012//NITZ4_007846-RA/size34440-processed-gene-0.17-mRNA-1//1//CDS//3329549377//3994//frame0
MQKEDYDDETPRDSSASNSNGSSALRITWEADMAREIVEKMQSSPNKRPYMVGVVGMPGAGKTTSTAILSDELKHKGIGCMIFPQDGYHFSMEYLRQLPDATEAIYRRGAPDTFDVEKLCQDLESIRGRRSSDQQGTPEERQVWVPGFDHARGDPEPNLHLFDRTQHQVVLCEGLYLLHHETPRDEPGNPSGTHALQGGSIGWSRVKELLDFTIFIDSAIEDCIKRIKVRNQCIPGYTLAEILERVDRVDRENAMTVLCSKALADTVVLSVASPLVTTET